MTSRSEFGSFVRLTAQEMPVAGQPLDTGLSRAIVNNTVHLYDVSGNVVINMTPTNYVAVGGVYLQKDWSHQTVSATTFERFTVLDSIPFVYQLRPSGDGAKLALYLRASCDSGSATFRFRVMLDERSLPASYPSVLDSPRTVDQVVTTTSTEYAMGPIWIPGAGTARQSRGVYPVFPSADEGLLPEPSKAVPARLEVWVSGSGIGIVARIRALMARETMAD
jgi:hypothetical protein